MNAWNVEMWIYEFNRALIQLELDNGWMLKYEYIQIYQCVDTTRRLLNVKYEYIVYTGIYIYLFNRALIQLELEDCWMLKFMNISKFNKSFDTTRTRWPLNVEIWIYIYTLYRALIQPKLQDCRMLKYEYIWI